MPKQTVRLSQDFLEELIGIRYPDLPNPGFVLWNFTCYPFAERYPVAHWLAQVDAYVADPSGVEKLVAETYG